MIFEGDDLENAKTVKALELIKDSTLFVVRSMKSVRFDIVVSQVDIVLGTGCGEPIKHNVAGTDTVKELKEQLGKRKDVKILAQRLLLNSEITDDERTLESYGVKTGMVVELHGESVEDPPIMVCGNDPTPLDPQDLPTARSRGLGRAVSGRTFSRITVESGSTSSCCVAQ